MHRKGAKVAPKKEERVLPIPMRPFVQIGLAQNSARGNAWCRSYSFFRPPRHGDKEKCKKAGYTEKPLH